MNDPGTIYSQLKETLAQQGVTLVTVSKIQLPEKIMQLYNQGQRDFGENYVQELVEKAAALPADIRWHFIGHLQTNKVKQVVPLTHLIQGVDSLKLLKEIDKQSSKAARTTNCLLQVFIADEETKYGLSAGELEALMNSDTLSQLTNVRICGLMGMASFSDDISKVEGEFAALNSLFAKYKSRFNGNPDPVLSMGMSGDYETAIRNGSTMVRIGSLLFGERKK